MAQKRVDLIEANSRFYQMGFRKLLTFSFVLVGVAYILLGVIIYLYISRPIPNYFVATSDGRLIEIHSLYEIQALGMKPTTTANSVTNEAEARAAGEGANAPSP